MKLLITALTLSLGLGAANITQAALVDRGGGLIYDQDLNITWLADANYAKTSGYDPYGYMNWSRAMTWAENLSYGGYTDWRLPMADPACGSSYNCTGSEMGHLYHNELGLTTGSPVLSSTDPDLALFKNLESIFYWTGTEYAPNSVGAWTFYFQFGNQDAISKDVSNYAWAVRTGDVATVPLPGAVWLFGSGLLGLLGAARARRKQG